MYSLLVVVAALIALLLTARQSAAFSAPSVPATKTKTKTKTTNQILILDHLNINHEKGRHDWLKAFYIDFLQCALDPRKMENVEKGKKTIWANIGANQFHLPEGKPDAQVLDGILTLAYPDLTALKERYTVVAERLEGSKFDLLEEEEGGEILMVIDPWGSKFRLIEEDETIRDSRGKQPGKISEGLGMPDLTINVPTNANLPGIGRFYEQVLGTVVTKLEEGSCVQIRVGPQQTLTFSTNALTTIESHVDLRDDSGDNSDDQAASSEAEKQSFLSNYGPHISMYVADLETAYRRANELGLAYVNPRFKRRAYTLEEAIDQCMFRCLDIVDPENVDAGTIVKLEHEVRSVVKRDGTKYKSCPFDRIPGASL